MGKAEKASAYRNSNIKVVEAVRKYSKGKKSVRTNARVKIWVIREDTRNRSYK